jgi:hypothetical protein
MSIEKSISPTLSNLIAEANYTIESVKEKILAAYNYAVEKDGYTPIEAAKVLRENLTFSKSYIREVLPLESKEQRFSNKPQEEDNEAPLASPIDKKEDDLQSKIPPEREPTIPTAWDIKEAELAEQKQEPEFYLGSGGIQEPDILAQDQKSDDVEDLKVGHEEHIIPQYIQLQLQERDTLKQHNKELLKKIEQLETKLSDHAFDVIKNTSNDIREGTYELPIKEKFIPLKWQYFITTNRIDITIDEPKAKRRGI